MGEFDAEGAVNSYREVIAWRDKQQTDLGRADCQEIADRMRKAWKERQGEDSLHEMAFGKPKE